jgi:hypothetical protein
VRLSGFGQFTHYVAFRFGVTFRQDGYPSRKRYLGPLLLLAAGVADMGITAPGAKQSFGISSHKEIADNSAHAGHKFASVADMLDGARLRQPPHSKAARSPNLTQKPSSIHTLLLVAKPAIAR